MKIKSGPKITPFLWFDHQAVQAAGFYVSLFKNSKIKNVVRYADESAAVTGRPKGSVMVVEFQLAGQAFTALNGGPHFKFTEAISLVVNCAKQKEADFFWSRLSRDGQPGQWGWLKDKDGLFLQIVPVAATALFAEKNPVKSAWVWRAMSKMGKLDLKALQRAYAERS